MTDDQNLDQNANPVQPVVPTASWSPETNQNAPTPAAVPPPAANSVPEIPVLPDTPSNEPVAVKPPILTSPENNQEVVFKPEPIAAEPSEPPAPVPVPDIDNQAIQAEVTPTPAVDEVVAPPPAPPAPQEGLTLPELTTRYYQARDKIESEASEAENLNQTIPADTLPPQPSSNQTPNLTESGHFSSLPGAGEIDTSAEEEFFQNNIVPKMPEQPPVNPENTLKSEIETPQVTAPALPAQPIPAPVELPKSGIFKKILLISVLVILAAGLLAGGYFGFVYWQKYNGIRVLNTAVKNLTTGGAMSLNYQLKSSDFSDDGKLNIDKDGDMQFLTEIESIPFDISYIKAEDKGYYKGPEDQYLVYTGVSSYLDKFAKGVTEAENTDALNSKNFGLLKYFSVAGSEQIGGENTAHYVFSPDQKYLDQYVNNNQDLKNGQTKITKLNVDVWIGKKDSKIRKLTFDSSFTVGGNDSNLVLPNKADVRLELGFDYGYSEDIKAPENPVILLTVDLNKILEAANPSSSTPIN